MTTLAYLACLAFGLMALHISMWTACVAKAAAVWAVAYIYAGWRVLPTAAWAGAISGPTATDRRQSEKDAGASSTPTYGTMVPTPELEPFGATSE